MDCIQLTDFRVSCIIGVLDREQSEPQPLDVEVRMWLDLVPAGDTDDLSDTVDYAAVREEIAFLAEHGHWRLLESLGVAALRHLLAPPLHQMARAQIHRAELRMRKPTILGGDAVPGITMSARRRVVEPGDPADRGWPPRRALRDAGHGRLPPPPRARSELVGSGVRAPAERGSTDRPRAARRDVGAEQGERRCGVAGGGAAAARPGCGPIAGLTVTTYD